MKRLYRFIVVFLLALLINSCKKDDVISDSNAIIFNPDLTYGTLTDINGFVYKTIQIGTQTWMAENLKVVKYNDGIDIPVLDEWYEWCGSTTYNTPGICWYESDKPKYMKTYGTLYKWYAVSTGKLCPVGWHVPTTQEWITLVDYMGGKALAGIGLKEAGTTHWNKGTGATNSSGFTALPSGWRDDAGWFYSINEEAKYWSATEHEDYGSTGYYAEYFCIVTNLAYINNDPKEYGLSVRCIKD